MALRRSLFALTALPLLALAGCDWGSTEPVSISLSFDHAHTLNADGSCQVQFVASAFGYGSATWNRVVVRESGAVVAEYTGTQFWGDVEIGAGERQSSAPFVAPDAGEDVVIEVSYRITADRSLELRPDCDAT